jgi:heme exporter protein B
MTIQTRTREVLLPVLLLPLSLPLVLPAAMTVSAYMFPQMPVLSEVQSPLSLVLIYDLLMLTAGFLTYHYVVES